MPGCFSQSILLYVLFPEILVTKLVFLSNQVFEFLEDISASLNDMATRELTMLKDLKVEYLRPIFSCANFICLHVICLMFLISWCLDVSEGRGRRTSIWN